MFISRASKILLLQIHFKSVQSQKSTFLFRASESQSEKLFIKIHNKSVQVKKTILKVHFKKCSKNSLQERSNKKMF